MPTKVFSGRADAYALEQADAIIQHEFGMSFGQYCATMLLPFISETGEVPHIEDADRNKKRKEALEYLKNLTPEHLIHPEIATYTDEQLKELIASRYA